MVVGFLTAFCYNTLIVVGKFLYGGGSPTRLPLSTEGCHENLFHQLANSTIIATSLPDNDLLGPDVFPEDMHNTTLPGEEMMAAAE